jgi:hypothetical protein
MPERLTQRAIQELVTAPPDKIKDTLYTVQIISILKKETQ